MTLGWLPWDRPLTAATGGDSKEQMMWGHIIPRGSCRCADACAARLTGAREEWALSS